MNMKNLKAIFGINAIACYSIFFSTLSIVLFLYQIRYLSNPKPRIIEKSQSSQNSIEEIRQMPIIFVSGYRRSGTTLMRTLLDVHDSIFCGPELKALSFYLGFLSNLEVEAYRYNYFRAFYLNMSTIYDASALFMHHILKNNLKKSDLLCAKDPTFIYNIVKLNKIFPKSKIIIMIRDGRASVFSLIKKSKLSNMSSTRFYDHLVEWNTIYSKVYDECNTIGPDLCKIVRYEDLIGKTEKVMKDVSKFLNIDFTSNFLNHQDFIGKDKKIVIESHSLSTFQVIKPIYKKSLKTWVGKIDYNKTLVKKNINMLSKFGYKIDFNDPNDGIALNVTKRSNHTKEFKKKKTFDF